MIIQGEPEEVSQQVNKLNAFGHSYSNQSFAATVRLPR